MCTAINEISHRHLFGRTLDLECSYEESVVITPRRFAFSFIHERKTVDHFAIIGAAHVSEGIPLYYDAMNEKGLCAAALRFQDAAVYFEKNEKKYNLASFELIPWLLANFESAEAAASALKSANVTPESFSRDLPSTPLHWMIGDARHTFVIEPTKSGLQIYDNRYGVMTNAPEFPEHEKNASSSLLISPGDLSSTSRFLNAVKAKETTLSTSGQEITRFFHIMGRVDQPLGASDASNGDPMRTVYTSCMDTESTTYYFTTYDCRKIRGVRMKNAHLDLDTITAFPMKRKEWIHFLN